MSQRSRLPRKEKKTIKKQLRKVNMILYAAEIHPEVAKNFAPLLPGLRQLQAEIYTTLENNNLKNVLDDLDIEVEE